MTKLISTILLTGVTLLNAQVIIGDAVGTAATKTSVLLDFATGQNKGLIVPYVRALPTGNALVGGSIILDATNPTTARMKYYNGTAWIDLSGQDGNVAAALAIQPKSKVDDPANGVDESSARAIIGDRTATVDGVLVLESTTQAMILPIVSDVQNIPSPSPGMMVYINKAGAKRLAVFNGNKWSFWKP